MQFAIHQGRVVFWNWPGWEDRGGGEGRAIPQWPAAGTRGPFPAAAGRIPRLPPVLFLPLRGLNHRRCLWKGLPKVSKNTLGFFFSAQLRLSRTHTPFWAQRGVVLRLGVRRAASQLPCALGSLLWFLALETQSPPRITPDRKDPEPPTHLVPGQEARRAADSPAVFHFQSAPCLSWGEDSARRFGKGRDNSPRAQAQRSLLQVFADAQFSIQSAGVPGSCGPSPPSRVNTLLESSWEAPEILLSQSWDTVCVSDSARTETNSVTYSGKRRTQ